MVAVAGAQLLCASQKAITHGGRCKESCVRVAKPFFSHPLPESSAVFPALFRLSWVICWVRRWLTFHLP